MDDEYIKSFYVDAIEHGEYGTLLNNIENIDKQIITEYFDKIIDLIAYNFTAVESMLKRLDNNEIDLCLKKLKNSNLEINASKLFSLCYYLDDKTRVNNEEIIYRCLIQCVKEKSKWFPNVWEFATKEEKIAVCKELLKCFEPLDSNLYYFVGGLDGKVIVENLKEIPDLPKDVVIDVWSKLKNDVKNAYIFELIDTYDDETIKLLLWESHNQSDEMLQEAAKRYKGTETLSYIINGTNFELLKENIFEIIEENKDDTNSLLYIWGGLNEKSQRLPSIEKNKENKIFIDTTENRLFSNIMPLIQNNPEQMIYVWKTNAEKLTKINPNVFWEIYEKVKFDNNLLIKLWEETRPDLQITYKDVFKEVVNGAREDKIKLKEIWEKTNDSIKNINDEVLVKIIELENNNTDEIVKTWESSPQEARTKAFKNICKIMKPDISDEKLEEINNAFISACCVNTDVAELLPTEFLTFYSRKNLESIGEDKLLQLACYPDMVKKINSMDNKQIQTIGLCCNRFMQKYDTSEWIFLFKDIVDNIQSFGELINSKESFTDEELDKLNIVLSDENIYEIKNVQELMNIEQIKKKKCDQLIKKWRESDKIEAICISKFGYSRNKLKKILDMYGRDYDKFENQNLKYFLGSIDMLLNMYKTEEQLQKIYDNVNPVNDINIRAVERQLKNEYAKMYDETLLKVSDAVPNQELGENVYELPEDEDGKIKDFNIIMTAIGAYNFRKVNNYYEDWNQNSRASQHFCASLINKYMLGHAYVMDICFGFSSLEKDSLVLLGPQDIGSSNKEVVSSASNGENYMNPDSLLEETNRYNEMDIYRMNRGIRKQPDYIICFRKDGEIRNFEKSKQASKDFEKNIGKPLPIIIIDEDRIENESIETIRNLFEEYKNNPSNELRDLIVRLVKRINIYSNEINHGVFSIRENSEIYSEMYWKYEAENSSWISYDNVKKRMNKMQGKIKDEENDDFAKTYTAINKQLNEGER